MKNTNKNSLSISGFCLILLTVLFSVSQAYAEAQTAADKRPMALPTNFDLSSVLRLNDSAAFNTAPTVFSAFLDPLQSSSIVGSRIDIGAYEVQPPTVTTPTSANITATGARLGGNVTSDGGGVITERGVVYALTGTNSDPLIGGTGVVKATTTGTTGVFTVAVTGLTQTTGYSFKAYATNSGGTSYSSVATFTTTPPDPTGAARLIVTTNSDVSASDGVISLREAVAYANTGTAGANPEITFNVTGIIQLVGANARDRDLVINNNLTIAGPGADSLTVKAADGYAVGIFNISGGIVSISGLKLSDGNGKAISTRDPNTGLVTSTSNYGGAIYIAGGTVTLTNCTLSNNSAQYGGAIYLGGGSLAVTGSTISGNNSGAHSYGGGILVYNGSLAVASSTISGNIAGFGGGLDISGGTATIESSTISGNTAREYTTEFPSGVWNSHNGNGGGIFINFAGTVTVTNSTISGNRAEGTNFISGSTSTQPGAEGGGGICNLGVLTVANSTVTANHARRGAHAAAGGGINTILGTSLQLSNSILANNFLISFDNNTPGTDLTGTASGNYNLVQNGTTLSGTNNITGQPALLGPLANNGGPTQTHALLTGSPAIDAGDPSFDTMATPFDQRGSGYARKSGSRIDIGAFEEQGQGSTTATAINYQPQNQSVCESASVNFSVVASGESLTYQWRKDAVNLIDDSTIFGATSANLMISSAAAGSAGSYDVVVSGANGTQTSSTATLAVNSAPAITTQPADQNVNSGGNASFTAAASGAQTVQWQVSTDGGASFSDISGATAGTLTLSAVASTQNGSKYRAVFTGACGNPATSGAATLTVGRLAQTITFNTIADKTYGDAPFALSASSTSNLPVSFSVVSGAATISGSTLTINSAGAVTISAAQTGNDQYNAAPSVERSFNVGKAQATITLSSLSQTYNGTAKSATATTDPSGLSVSLTYDGSSTAPINSGSYAVTATINDANYQGTANGTLTIAKATPVVTWNNPADIAYGTRLSATQLNATASVAGSFAYDPLANTLLNSGANQNLSATFTPDDANNYAAVNRSVTINVLKANQTITFANPGTKTFGDADFAVSASSDSGLTVSFAATAGNCSMVNSNTVHITGAGSCEITALQAGDGNYNQATSVPRSFTINQATQTISFSALSSKFIGSGGIIVSATGGNSGNPVTFASSTTSVCTSSGTNGTTITFVGLGTCTITASQAGSSNYGAATGVSQSFQVNADPTTVTLDTTGHNFINFECATNVISATVKDSVTGAWIQNATVNFVIGSQTVSATTDTNGKASVAVVLNQQPGPVTVSASYAGSGNGYNLAGSAGTTKTISASTNVGPGQNASSLYTGSLYYWTTSSTSSTATLMLSATLKDTLASCLGDITKAKVSFYISTGGSFSPVSGAQNLPVGLVNPTDTSVGTASAISQYNIGNNQSVTLTVRVVVSGQYNLDTTQYDQLITIGKPGQANSLMGGGQIKNDGNPFPANGYLGLNSVNSSFGSQVKFNNSGTNPQGQVQVYIRSCNNSDGTLDPNCDPSKPETHHVYFIKSNSISELSTINGSASFGSKTNVSEVLANGSKVGLDGGGTMQVIFTPFGKTIPRDMYVGSSSTCTNQQGCMSITAYKSTGGVWYSSSWGQGAGTTAPHTYVKNVLPGGAIAVQ